MFSGGGFREYENISRFLVSRRSNEAPREVIQYPPAPFSSVEPAKQTSKRSLPIFPVDSTCLQAMYHSGHGIVTTGHYVIYIWSKPKRLTMNALVTRALSLYESSRTHAVVAQYGSVFQDP